MSVPFFWVTRFITSSSCRSRIGRLACTDRDLSRATRTRLVEEYAARGTRLLPGHFPAPTTGRIVRHGSAFRYVFD
jgi:hypothetical protein